MTEFQKKYRGLLGDGEDGYIDYDGIQSLIEENEKQRKYRKTIFATFIHDPQHAHANIFGEFIDEYKFFERIEDARKDILEELLNLYARNDQLTHENDRELKVWLAANEIWPTDKDDEALDEWPIGRQEMNDEGTIACLYEIHLNCEEIASITR